MEGDSTDEGIHWEWLSWKSLPHELSDRLQSTSGSRYLDALAKAALVPRYTARIYLRYTALITEIAGRWLKLNGAIHGIQVAAAFARILPCVPFLRSFTSHYILRSDGPLAPLASAKELWLLELDDENLTTLLLAIFRLLSFDLETYSTAVSPLQLQSLFQHKSRTVRYLAIRCFCLYMHSADASTERILNLNLGHEVIEGQWEGRVIDYRLLGLWEEQRWQRLGQSLETARRERPNTYDFTQVDQFRSCLSADVAEICGVLVPRSGTDPVSRNSALVKTRTTEKNLRQIAISLLGSKPILLLGLPNAGKTSLIDWIASATGQGSSMITLHLNEQTDAKNLLGMYATSSATGTFTWQPGVLTKAAREGRWVLIEDLDRAPSEVIGLILPIIEKRELVIPSRKERIKCADGFKIIGTVKTSINNRGEETSPVLGMLGARLWESLWVHALPLAEVREIIDRRYPLISSRSPLLIEAFDRINTVFASNLSVRSSQGRAPGLRDLLKLCSRLESRLERLGARSGNEPIPESFLDNLFLDAVDILLRYLPDKTLVERLSSIVAEVFQISPQRASFCLHDRRPPFHQEENEFAIGREMCERLKVPKTLRHKFSHNSQRFAPTRSALATMEQIAAAVTAQEPVLLVGETGIGKTATIQQLALLMRQKLTVVNLSQQSESTDLLGGFRPINIRSMAMPLLDDFNRLFETTFSAKKNAKFLASVAKSARVGNWSRLISLWQESTRMVQDVFQSPGHGPHSISGNQEQPAKKRKLDSPKYATLRQSWDTFQAQLGDFEAQVSRGDSKFAFAFVQGKIVRALRNGEWVLLDEINLATPDILENISTLLQHGEDGRPSVLLPEAGDVEKVYGNPNFRIFGAMNPATDAGKRDLAPGLRSRFTEIYVHGPDGDSEDLLNLIATYLGDLTLADSRVAFDLANLYVETKQLEAEHRLTDGAGQRPHFSIRTLVRTLIYILDHANMYGIRRAMYEGFCMSFLTVLSQTSEQLVVPLIEKHIFSSLRNARSLLSQAPKPPADSDEYVQFKHYWMKKGPYQPENQPHYIITPFIEKNLKNLLRASSTRRFPILLQGPTSSGKTSMVEYLAKLSGNKFVRINNHEHTDLQEYLGSYVSTDDGSLRYQEGVLVEALRNGYWIVLDELNLAPSDVLEALNRLLDDNRELFLPETQEVIQPHPNFMLFATQNPAGLYGGRKILSRAFRNRFLELHFDDIPENELEYILKERTQIAPSFCSRIVSVYKKLSLVRQSSRLFEQKNSFATLRDLFRWALRPADDREQLAVNGFMLLAERVRNPQEKALVKGVIEEVMRVRIDENVLYSLTNFDEVDASKSPKGIIWTKAMRRLYTLVSRAIDNNEPVLLVGETGCGKTQLCQAIAEARSKELHIVNAHVNLETGDLIGAQRPLRNRASIESQLLDDLRLLFNSTQAANGSAKTQTFSELLERFVHLSINEIENSNKELLHRIRANIKRSNALFEWCDGSLINAMKTGQYFLLDEISLADDSVLERLNSLLEPHRTILLAEKGPIDSLVVANHGFQFLSTMNPGGDYGKRELSAALRNRMTEIWVPQLSEDEDILPILSAKLSPRMQGVQKGMLEFAKWFKLTFQNSNSVSVSLRDLLGWVEFVNRCSEFSSELALLHGAALVYIDTLGANPSAILSMAPESIKSNRNRCLERLSELFSFNAAHLYYQRAEISGSPGNLRVGPFVLPVGKDSHRDPQFVFHAPTTISNCLRVARGLQTSKPILLEGSPGVGKTTLVSSLAQVLGKPLTRINLSEQTDLTDLFGSDVPVEGGDVGKFAWRDAPFLRAMQNGDWVLLDEMNLASQSVLEGLNSCIDHRQQVYVAELDQTFSRHPDFVLFAAQNPHHQGGGRKGLPASFVNRFTVVYADSFREKDMKMICSQLFPRANSNEVDKAVEFVSVLNNAIFVERRIGLLGGPWEINLRDIYRWLQVAGSDGVSIPCGYLLDAVLSQRFRTQEDRQLVLQIYASVFGEPAPNKSYYHNLTTNEFQVGFGFMKRNPFTQHLQNTGLKISVRELPALEALIFSINAAWPAIVVGASGSGKTSLIRKLATISGANLVELGLSAETDTMDLIGGFEQIDYQRQISSLRRDLSHFLLDKINAVVSGNEATDSTLVTSMLTVLSACRQEVASLETLHKTMIALHSMNYRLQEIEKFIKECEILLQMTRSPTRVGFEWSEGALTEAIQKGYWVVLDNANLCNPSVLDRLNSLMEPNGCLVLNERRTEDGSAETLVPHPNFRIFLTMDPRNGELSRAMRNRSVEVCLLPIPMALYEPPVGVNYTQESLLYRLRQTLIAEFNSAPSNIRDAAFGIQLDHLSTSDLMQFSTQIEQLVLGQTSTDTDCSLTATVQRYKAFSEEKVRQNFSTEDQIRYTSESSPIHPLVNEPLLSFRPQSHERAICLSYLQEFSLRLLKLQRSLTQARNNSGYIKPSEMTRLERSLAQSRMPNFRKDVTSPVGTFLSECSTELRDFLRDILQHKTMSSDLIPALRSLIYFLWDIYETTNRKNVDEAEFQAYLQVGSSLLSEEKADSTDLSWLTKFSTRKLSQLNSTWALSSGLSMQRIWEAWRPLTCLDESQLNRLVELEQIEATFRDLSQRTQADLMQLSKIRTSLYEAQRSVIIADADVELLVSNLQDAVSELKISTDLNNPDSNAHFVSVFEILCQFQDLGSIWHGSGFSQQPLMTDVLPLLAGRPARPQDSFSVSASISALFSKLASFGGFNSSVNAPPAWSGGLTSELLEKLTSLQEATLNQLHFVETEGQLLAQILSLSTCTVLLDQRKLMLRALSKVCLELLVCHEDLIDPASFETVCMALRAVEKAGSYHGPPISEISCSTIIPPNHYFLDVATGICSCVDFITKNIDRTDISVTEVGRLFVKVSTICLYLFVPDRSFDPALRLVVQRDRYSRQLTELQVQDKALQLFEGQFSGQSTNLRRLLLQQDLTALGSRPPAPAVLRPDASRLSELQGDFTNLINSVIGRQIENFGIFQYLESGKLIQNNVRQVCRRLESDYRSYEDITRLVVGFLQMLDLGISLVLSDHPARSNPSSVQTTSRIPLLGGRVHPLLISDKFIEESPRGDLNASIERLSVLVATQMADRNTIRRIEFRLALQQALEYFYRIWKTKLIDEQKEETERSRTYRYRGSFEDDEEVDETEFRALFPIFEDVTEETKDNFRMDPRQLSIKLSQLHTAIFKPSLPQRELRSLVFSAAQTLGRLGADEEWMSSTDPSTLLPGAFLLLKDQMQLFAAGHSANYNFYTDPNISEAKKLVAHVQSIQNRFLELQSVWPEHAAIKDVIVCCREILVFKHTEPVAKFLTKVERLHALVHEWQLVASKEYSAASHYDSLTTLIINWRRLELSTWARLLDIEDEKCREDADAWWFIAYEVLIFIPVQMATSNQDLAHHVSETIATLEQFFFATTVGQFSSRLRLVENFRLLLSAYAADYPALSSLAASVGNFVEHFKIFEPTISKFISDSRKVLEKDISQQVQLASWKDTNINALRESARRSHYKLFKVVRKYRGILSQPAQITLQQGMPDLGEVSFSFSKYILLPSTSAPEPALAICQQSEQLWSDRGRRFKDPRATAANMLRVYEGSMKSLDVPSQLDLFIKDITESIKDFRSQTPKILTEENKETVQHLKTQKRRFYAETLRQLHFMGVRRNVSAALLEDQVNKSQILGNTPYLLSLSTMSAAEIESADSHFHRFLDILPRVRLAAREYSEDISPVEATRSAGLAEGLLLMMRKQRRIVFEGLSGVEELKSLFSRMRNLCSYASELSLAKQSAMEREKMDIVQTLSWLEPIIAVAIEIVQIHADFSKSEQAVVVSELDRLRNGLGELKQDLTKLPELPKGLSSKTSKEMFTKAHTFLQELDGSVAAQSEAHPELSFVLDQVRPWTQVPPTSPAEITASGSSGLVTNFNTRFLQSVDKVLVALQGTSSQLSKVPSSMEEKDWLSITDSSLSKALKNLHLTEITSSFNSLLEDLHLLTEEPLSSALHLAVSIVGSVLPIIEQYRNISQALIHRYISIHRELCKVSHILAKSFVQIASEGFCSPSEPSKDEGQSGKVESGTGLGDGEGAEDISKDIQDDEDLTELAQEQSQEEKDEGLENSKDAVDMDQEELEGQYDNEREEKEENQDEEGSDQEGDDDIDEEVGSVGSLDPEAVDEKLWDGGNDEEQKDKENDQGTGQPETDKQTASNEKQKGEQQDGEEQQSEGEEEPPEDEAEAIGREEMDVMDPHAKEEQTLDLPEEMQLDGEENDKAESDLDDGMDELSDLDPEGDHQQNEETGDNADDKELSTSDMDDVDMEEDEKQPEADEPDEAGETEQGGEENAPEEEAAEPENELDTKRKDSENQPENIAPSEAVTGGVGEDQDNENDPASGDATKAGAAESAAQTEDQSGAAEAGQDLQRTSDPSGGGESEIKRQDPQIQGFKKLGDVLEQWHRRQKEIMNATEEKEPETIPPDTDMADAEFEHLVDENDVTDTQALGQASEELAKALDNKMAVEDETTNEGADPVLDVTEDMQDIDTDKKRLDEEQLERANSDKDIPKGATFAARFAEKESYRDEGAADPLTNEILDEVDSHLAAIHLSSNLAPLTPPDEARRLWVHYESVTHDLSLFLTEQLRLILAPTLSTKLRGDFRTGKRLNLKRIIPYIASQYKRDKIWMRRSIPSKRNYQIMLAVDDSKSMMESGCGQLAFETLALVTRSLSMLEVGELCIVGFGDEDHVRVAHEFGKPFSSEAGTQVFQQFSYQQTGTNVRKLVADSIALFREARFKRAPAGGANSADLWQLELIISDGICEDHDTIRRLVRQAQEERIMMVFIILDAAASGKGNSSILDLTQASFEPDEASGTGEMKLKMKRYLEGFPFSYYLVVRDVRELPAVLSTALKQWFAEVVDSTS